MNELTIDDLLLNEFYERGCQQTFFSPGLWRSYFLRRPAPFRIDAASRCELWFRGNEMSSVRRHQQLQRRPDN